MEFTQEFIQEIGLDEAQVSKISEFTDSHISELENGWKGKANENAEKILEGASSKVELLTGIHREKGQKIADYIGFASENYFKGQRSDLERKEKELDDKIKNAGHDDTLLKELEDTKSQLTKLKEKEAMFSDWEENDYKGKFEATSKELSDVRLNLAFNGVKPSFPESANEYEANYKWEQFKTGVLSKYEIKIVDNEAIVVDKDNEFKTQKLADLVKKDEGLSSLLKGEKKGIGSKPKSIKIKDVPFDVPENATSQERTKVIREYLASKNIAITSPEYSKQFAELNSKILSQKIA